MKGNPVGLVVRLAAGQRCFLADVNRLDRMSLPNGRARRARAFRRRARFVAGVKEKRPGDSYRVPAEINFFELVPGSGTQVRADLRRDALAGIFVRGPPECNMYVVVLPAPFLAIDTLTSADI